MTGRTIDELAVGQAAEATYTVTREAIREFVLASGDINPIHSDAEFAASTRFGRVIAPGMLTSSFVSAVIGTRLPGPGTIYLSQELRFLKPVYVGDRVTARVEVVERLAERNRLRLQTTCRNDRGGLLLEGEAWVLPSREHIEYPERRWSAPGRPLVPLGYAAPVALGLRIFSLWMAGGLAIADQMLRSFTPATAADAPRADLLRS